MASCLAFVFWWKEVGYDGKHDQSQAKIEEYTLNNMVRDFTYYCTFPDPPMIASASPSKPKPTHPFSAMIFQALSLIILSAIAHLFGFPPPPSPLVRHRRLVDQSQISSNPDGVVLWEWGRSVDRLLLRGWLTLRSWLALRSRLTLRSLRWKRRRYRNRGFSTFEEPAYQLVFLERGVLLQLVS